MSEPFVQGHKRRVKSIHWVDSRFGGKTGYCVLGGVALRRYHKGFLVDLWGIRFKVEFDKQMYLLMVTHPKLFPYTDVPWDICDIVIGPMEIRIGYAYSGLLATPEEV